MRTGEKQILRVLAAFRHSGARTSRDAADITGLSIKHCSHYASALAADGFLRKSGPIVTTCPGRRSHWFEPEVRDHRETGASA